MHTNLETMQFMMTTVALSSNLSKSYSEAQMAKMELDDAFIDELTGGTERYGTELMRGHLGKSHKHLQDLLNDVRELRAKLIAPDQKLPSTANYDFEGRGKSLSERKLVQPEAWNKVAVVMKREGYLSLVAYLEHEVTTIRGLTDELKVQIETLEPIAKTSGLHKLVGANQPGNPTGSFMVLLTRWSELHAQFQAALALTTDVWYGHQGAPQL